jgi:hypothetical protein
VINFRELEKKLVRLMEHSLKELIEMPKIILISLIMLGIRY